MSMRIPMAVFRYKYLPISETFIYEQLIQLKKYKPYVFTREITDHADLFPFKRVVRLRKKSQIYPFIKTKKCKLIHARFGSGGIQMLPVKKRAKLPLLTSFHGSDLSKQVRNQRYRKQLTHLFRAGEAFTVVSEHMKKRLISLGCPAQKITILKSGIHLEKLPFLPRHQLSEQIQSDGSFRILTVGRLVEKKGTDLLLRAFTQILKRYPSTRLIIVGDGPRKKELQLGAKQLGVQSRVKWKGALSHSEVINELKRSHLFVLPSRTGKDGDQEGIPNSIMEAMAIGRVVISTRHAGIPELIVHEQTGFLAPEGDHDALANMIQYVLESPLPLEEILHNARKKIEREHDILKQANKLEQIYDQVLKKERKK